jgi:phage terminase small subunit
MMADLTDKQQAFVEHYLTCWNASEAARLAGYSPKTAAKIGSENLQKPDIARVIEARLAELKMGADEVLTRLADHARGSLKDFVDVNTGEIDLAKAEKAGKLHLLKKYKKTRRYFKGELSEESVDIELHDAQAADVWLGKHHKLFTENHAVTGKVEIEYVNDWRRDNAE